MDPDRLAALRRRYERPALLEADLDPDPVAQFAIWFDDATVAEDEGLLVEANAVVMATAGADGAPSARTVLLKAFDSRGFVVFTNYASAKARDVESNPRAALVFPWHPIDRQVRVTGRVERIARDESQAYFASRPWGSKVAAWASEQSHVIADRAVLEARFAELATRWPEGTEVPAPEFWGGLRVVPDTLELWQGRPDRLHDRLRYVRAGDAWRVERLAP